MMGQIITVECQSCEGVERYETEGVVILIRNKDGEKDQVVRHDMDGEDLLIAGAYLIDDYFEQSKDREDDPHLLDLLTRAHKLLDQYFEEKAP